ncbi:MAG: conjugal transfer protein TraF [Vicinamibacterales bacterium]
MRASGMAGAFVAVADDATAVYWNPAGLATGALASFTFDYGIEETFSDVSQPRRGGQRHTAGSIALGLPPFGLTYYRMGEYVAAPPEAAVTNSVGREEVRRTVQAVVTTTVGATVLQSITDYLVVGTTLKLVRGGAGRGSIGVVNDREALRRAGQIARREKTTGDLDVGVMVTAGPVRAGAVARNLTTPAFALDELGSDLLLDRQVRVGGAWGSGWPGRSRVIVAADADITRRRAMDGDRRDVAVGAEVWWLRQRLGVRGGVRSSTVGERRASVSSGLSAGIANGIYLDAQAATGAANQRSWSAGLRIMF